MSTWPLGKFVDSPSTSATVRFDCNDKQATAPREIVSFDPGVPTLEGDPEAVNQTWGFRSPSVTVRINGTKLNALAALSALSREQLRRTNWFMFQLSNETQPLWFKTYRTGYQSLSLERVWVRTTDGGREALPDTWEITVPLVAEAFAYGARVTLSTFQVVQSPADLTSPTRTAMRIVLPAIKGDAPTSLRVAVAPTSDSFDPGSSWLIACVAGETTMSDPVLDIGSSDGFTAGSGTGAGVANAAYFNGSYRLVTISAGANLLQRLSGNTPVSVPLGRYKVLLRCEADLPAGAPKTYLFAFGQPKFNGTAYGLTTSLTLSNVTNSADTFQGWVDLGDFNFPYGVSSFATGGATTPWPISLKIGTADSSAGSVKIDAIKYIPIDGSTVTSRTTLLKATFSANAPLTNGFTGTFDGDSESYWATGTGTYLQGGCSITGAFPVADPASSRNLLLLMALNRGALATGSTITTKDAQTGVDVSYHPRWLHIGDGT